jgi:hypothetical protein
MTALVTWPRRRRLAACGLSAATTCLPSAIPRSLVLRVGNRAGARRSLPEARGHQDRLPAIRAKSPTLRGP